MSTNDVTPVIFRVFKGTRDVIAIFPYEPGTNDPGTCMSYMHMGQHGSCDPQGVIARTTLASWAIYDSLRKELESEGPGQYRLSIIKRMPSDAYRRRADAIRASRAPTITCTKCGKEIDKLEAFPGDICLDCYRPEGERLHRTMTAEKLTRMWGGGR